MKRWLYFVILLAFVVDTGYSFLQFYNTPFDGDMAGGIVPADHVIPVLNSPLGFDVFTASDNYANPNRFFSHWSFYEFFNRIPHFFFGYMDSVSAAYFSCAISKIFFFYPFVCSAFST